MKTIIFLLLLTVTSFPQFTPLKNRTSGTYTQMSNGDTIANNVWVWGEVKLDSATIANLTGTDTLFWGVTDTSASKKLEYGDSIFSVNHTNPYLFYEITVYDSLNGATAAALTDSFVVESWDAFTSTWSAISVLNENTGVRVTTLAPTSGVTRIYSVKIPYAAYGRDLRVRRTNIANIIGRSSWVTIRGIN